MIHMAGNVLLAIAVIVILALLMAACAPSTVVTALEAVVTAAEVAIPIIGPAAGLPMATTTAIIQYLQLVNQAAAQASTILAGTGTPAQKAADILKAFSNVAAGCNCIPAGTPAAIVQVINGVGQAIATFLENFHPVTTPPVTAAAKIPNLKVSAKDRDRLKQIQQRAEQNLAKLKGSAKQ